MTLRFVGLKRQRTPPVAKENRSDLQGPRPSALFRARKFLVVVGELPQRILQASLSKCMAVLVQRCTLLESVVIDQAVALTP